MISGRLNKRITVEHVVTTHESITGSETVRTESFQTRADVRWGSGSRVNTEDEILYSYDATFMVWLYLKERISMYDEIIYAGRRFIIMSVEPEPDSRILYLKCKSK